MFEVALYFFAGVGVLASLCAVWALLVAASSDRDNLNPWD